MTPHVELLVEAVAVVGHEFGPDARVAVADGRSHASGSSPLGTQPDGPLISPDRGVAGDVPGKREA
jgi:hypothetical protein